MTNVDLVNGAKARSGLALDPIRLPQVYEHVVSTIKGEIASGGLRPGDRLPSERDLARTLRVGRPSVREAIAELQNEGIVKTRQSSGTFVAPDAPDVLVLQRSAEQGNADASPSALLDVRVFLEAATARLAALRAQPDEQAEEFLGAMEQVSDVGNAAQRAVWSDSDRLFHRQIGIMTDNPFFAEFADRVAQVMDQPLWRRLRDEAVSDPLRVKMFAAEHRMIYEATVAGDPEAASFYAAQHLRRVRSGMGLE
jgi:DNA-binding FadR family transcriptional regulator